MNWNYNSLSAEVYQLDKAIGTSFGDVEYYAQRLQGINGKILEAGVGTGRILIPLLQQGLDVLGFDYSKQMLDYCQKNLASQQLAQDCVQQFSFTDFDYNDVFDAIIVPTGTILLLQHAQDFTEFLQRSYQHLADQGRLIFDIFFQHNFQVGHTTTRTFHTENNDLITLQITQSAIDYVQQTTTTHHRYEKWRDQQIIQSEFEIFSLHWYGIAELKQLLSQAGFSDIQFCSDYDPQQAPHNDSEIITVEAYKK
ncbi:class I SAM-dependent methyltransferase [Acinetobacter larvae]|uniref:SAM-dependent methyltransferase n=1 Tax=Acinetobacter larvae TaxID=1789224 RepID=A0A1B2M3T7_9GAMM|nr:class I SAM-dependent methyltransferase [Acinetobacter larvae]AOA59829.1 SAM-dependent methyltransferase [Acinetobacter larvae]